MRVLFATKLLEDRTFHPLSVAPLSAAVRKAGHEPFLVDATSLEAVFRRIREVRPRVLAVSTTSMRYRFFQRLCARVKESFPEIFTVVGGIHVTLAPQTVRDEGIDAICRGEGDQALVELLSRLENGKEYFDTTGFWFNKGAEVYQNPVAPLIEDLDLLPFPDRTIADNYPYCREFPVGMFITSRGCPFRCTFCCNAPWKELYGGGKFYRTESPARAIEGIRRGVRHHGYKRLMLLSEVFAPREGWLAEFTRLYREGPNLPFWCALHANIVTEGRARLLAEAGCFMAELGIETGDERFRKEVLDRPVTDERIIEAIAVLHRHGIRVQATNILALPGGSLEMDLKTLDLNLRARPELPEICFFTPLPGTHLTRRAEELGTITAGTDAPTTINPSARSFLPENLPDRAAVENLGLLFPVVARLPFMRRAVPFLIRLPLRPVYLLIYKASMSWYKVRYFLGGVSALDRRYLRFLWMFLRY